MKMHRSWIIVAAVLGIGFCADAAWGKTLRIVSYNIDCADQGSDNNITGATHSLPTVVQAIGLHHIGTNAQQVDILGVEELTSTTLSDFTTQLNNIYGAGTYAFDTTADPNTGGGPDGVIYNTHTVQVISARALRTGQNVLLQSNGTYTAAHSPGGGVNGITRAPMVYLFRPAGSGTSNDFYMYVSHARSTSDDAMGDARYAEAQAVRSDAKYNLPAGAHILYSGDWNLFSGSGENAYKCLTGQTTSDAINWSDGSALWANTNQTQGFDPMSKTSPPTTVTWANVAGDNASYLYNDSTALLSSRIDVQLMNAQMLGVYNSQGGVQLAPDTSDPFDSTNFPSSQYPYAFESFGNNGTPPRGSIENSASNHSLDDLTNTVPSAATVYADIRLMGSGGTSTGSDHYPIVGDYNVVVPQVLPAITVPPASQTNTAGTTVMFTVSATGTAPLSYQWQRGSTNLSDAGNISGSLTTNLTLTNLALADAGNFTVIVSNGAGAATSSVAVLTVICPLITVGPASLPDGTVNISYLATNTAGGGVGASTFAVTGGLLPDGLALDTNSGVISGTSTNAGTNLFTVTATDAAGCTGSSSYTLVIDPATVTVNPPSLILPGFETNGNFQFTLSSATNTGFEIQASTNLADWTNIGSGFTGTNGLLFFEDTNAAGFSNRFYRAYWPIP